MQGKTAPILVTGLLLAGLAMIGIGSGWSSFVPSSAYWGPDEAKELINAQADLHAKTHSHGNEADQERDFAAARERLGKIQQQLDAARSNRDRTGMLFTIFGVVLLLAGILLHFTARQPT